MREKRVDNMHSTKRRASRPHHQRVRLLALLLPLVLLLSACESIDGWLYEDGGDSLGAEESPSPSPSPNIPDGPATSDLFGLAYVAADIDPIRGGHKFNELWQSLVYEGLFTLDGSFSAQPALCALVTSEEHLVYHLTLRSNVHFHNGAPLTAQDVLASLETAREASSIHAMALRYVVSATAVGDLQVDITLSRADPSFPSLLTFPILPKTYDGVPPGTGRFRMENASGQPYLVANTDWWSRSQSGVTRIELTPVSDAGDLIYAMESRSVSAVVSEPLATLTTVYPGDYEQFSFDSPDLHFLGVNMARPFLNDARFRRALAQAIDWEELGVPKTQITPSSLPVPPSVAWGEAFAEPISDPNEVSILLSDMGLTERNEDGVLIDRSGWSDRAVSLTLLVSLENDLRVSVAENISVWLRKYGMDVSVEALPFDDVTERLEKGEFDLYYGQTRLPENFEPTLFEKGEPLGYGGAESTPALTELWSAYALSAAPADAVAYWTAWLEERPILPLFFEQHLLLAQRGFFEKALPRWGYALNGCL